VYLTLGTYISGTNGYYSVDGGTTNIAPKLDGVSGYYLQGSKLQLLALNDSGAFVPDHAQILNADDSYVYENGKWKNSIEADTKVGSGDITDIVAAFLRATPNPNAANPSTNLQQVAVVTNMITYMSNYYYWASNGFTSSLRTSLGLVAKQQAMMQAVQGLYQGANFPTPIACP